MELIGGEDLEGALTPVRETLQADGADVQVAGWNSRVLTLDLRLETVECADCVLPRESLEQTMLLLLQPSLPSLQEVRVTDPRESASDPV